MKFFFCPLPPGSEDSAVTVVDLRSEEEEDSENEEQEDVQSTSLTVPYWYCSEGFFGLLTQMSLRMTRLSPCKKNRYQLPPL